MNDTTPPASPTPTAVASSWKKPALIIAATILGCCTLTAVGTVWWVKRNIYASPLTPVRLTDTEQAAFNQKLAELEMSEEVVPAPDPDAPDDPRTINLSSKEINAFLAQQGIGEQVKITLSNNRVAANFLVPIDENAPLFGGTTLRIRLALSALMNDQGKLIVKVDDVSLGGIPLPNAWIGDIKGLDLITSDIGGDPTLQRFAAGIKDFEIRDGHFRVVLNE